MEDHRLRKTDPLGIITTVAGSRSSGHSGDGRAAVQAELFSPGGMALDEGGNGYFAEYYSTVVQKVDSSGKITTLAGTGAWGSSGDGGPATEAEVDFPSAHAVDIAGNFDIAEGSRVRKVIASGTIATLADFNDLGGAPQSKAVDESGNVYV